MINKIKLSLIFVLFAILAVPLFWVAFSVVKAATNPVEVCVLASKLVDGKSVSYTGCGGPIDLKVGEEVRFAIRVGIDSEVVSELKYRVNFPTGSDPKTINLSVQADALAEQSAQYNLKLPAGSKLVYLPGTTVYETYLGGKQYNDMKIADVGGQSPLASTGAATYYTISNVGKVGDFIWTFMFFDLKVESEAAGATTVSSTGQVLGTATVLPATGPEQVVGISLYLGYLGFLLRRLKLTNYF